MPSLSHLRPSLAAALAIALLSAVACGSGDDAVEDTLAAIEGDQAAMTAPTASAAAEPTAPTADANAPLTVDDIDRWQRGMEAELAAVREAGASLARATTSTDSATAIFAANDMATRDEGARGAGVDEERYARIAGTLSDLAGLMAPLSATMSVEGMSADMQKQMQEGRDRSLAEASKQVPAEVLEALRPRAEALRRQALELVGERLKAAGMGR